jgi:transposase
MTDRKFLLTTDEVQALNDAYHGCKDGPGRTRYQAVRLYGTGYPLGEVLQITGCSRSSLMDWCRRFRSEGARGLVDKRRGGNNAKLDREQVRDLAVRLLTCTPGGAVRDQSDGAGPRDWTVRDLRMAVQSWYGVSYRSPSSYHRLFSSVGFRYDPGIRAYRPDAGRVWGPTDRECGVIDRETFRASVADTEAFPVRIEERVPALQ